MKLSFRRDREAPSRSVPTHADFPTVSGADIAGMVHGQRMGGDFYHFLRANPNRVVFGLLDIAGSHEENQQIVSAAQQTFQKLGSQRFADGDINEADTMMEFCLELNLSIRRAAAGVRSCSAFLGCYNEELGTICYANAGHTPGLLRDLRGSPNWRPPAFPWDCFLRLHMKRRPPLCNLAPRCFWCRGVWWKLRTRRKSLDWSASNSNLSAPRTKTRKVWPPQSSTACSSSCERRPHKTTSRRWPWSGRQKAKSPSVLELD